MARDSLWFVAMKNVDAHLYSAARRRGRWIVTEHPLPPHAAVNLLTAENTQDVVMAKVESLLQPPTTMLFGTRLRKPLAITTTAPLFDAACCVTEQHFATSRDGTRVPYYLLRRKDFAFDGRAAGLVSAFSNTAFLGLPFVLARYPGSPSAATTAVVIDTVDTTILLLTLGVGFATTMARTRPPTPGPRLPRLARAALQLLLRPMLLAVLVGLALALSDTPLPDLLATPLTQVGQATPTLAFLTIGLGLDLRSLRGQTLALAGIAGIKLLLMPALVAGILLALDVHGDVAHVAVLQAAMPTAAHFIYIPAMLMLGIVIGYVLGSRAARDALLAEQARKEARAARRARLAAAKDGPGAEVAAAPEAEPESDGPASP